MAASYIIDPAKVEIPDKGLGAYLIGFTEEGRKFQWKNILWNLLPIAGQIYFIILVISFFYTKHNADRFLIYSNGFVNMILNGKGELKSEIVYNFDDIQGFMLSKTRRYVNGIYGGTDVSLKMIKTNGDDSYLAAGSYRKENETPGHYNYVGSLCNAINNAWIQYAIKRCNTEFAVNGYVRFAAPKGEIFVASDYVKYKDRVLKAGFEYEFNNGFLTLYPDAIEAVNNPDAKKIAINVAGMYNKEVFLIFMQHIHGVI